MEILILLIIVSLSLAAAGVGFFVWTVKRRTYDHSAELSLLPLDADASIASFASGEGNEE